VGISGASFPDCIPPALRTKMFIGEYTLSIDEKGRLSIPVKFRSELKGKAVVTRGLDSSLFLYPEKEWLKLAEKLASLPISKANTRAFARLMLAGAMDCEIDKAGRIILPDYLRTFAKINTKQANRVVVAGLYSRLEIWSEDLWLKYKKATEKNSTDIAEQLGEIGV
jgi:MraZ protein